MSMSTEMYAILAPTEDYRKALRAWHALRAAGVDDIPDELADRLWIERGTTQVPNESGAMVPLGPYGCDNKSGVKAKEVHTEDGEGLEVALADLPPGTTHVRCINSW